MTLDSYITETGVTGVELAARLGISEASLTRIRRGEQNIARDLIRRIVEATDGAVSADDLVFGDIHGPTNRPVGGDASRGKTREISPSAQVAA